MAATGAMGAVVRIVTITLLFSVLYVGAVIILHGGSEPLDHLLRLLPDMFPWSKSSDTALTPEDMTLTPEVTTVVPAVPQSDGAAASENSRLWPEEAG
jgi:hypothetical protein